MKIKLKNTAKNFFTNPINIVILISLIFLAYTILIPLAQIIASTFTWSDTDLRLSSDAIPGKFTLYHWFRILSSNISSSLFYKPFFNSISVGIAVAILSMVIGSTLAWLMVRTNIRFKKAIGFLAIIPYLLPSWATSLAWLSIFKNQKIGGTSGIFQWLFNINPPDWISYGFVPIVTSLSIHDSIYFYLIISVALASMSSSLEEAGTICGANKFTVLRKIVLPIILPSILSGFILIFTRAISSYGVPAILGTPVKFQTIATMLYSSVRSQMTSDANVLSLILIIVSIFTLFINQKLIGKRKSFVTVTGKSSRNTIIDLGKMKNIVTMLLLCFFSLVSIIPLILIFLQTLLLKDGVYSLKNLTLHYWLGEGSANINTGEPGIFKNDTFFLGLKNSLTISFTAAIITAIIGLVLGYIISTSKGKKISKAMEQISFLPYLIPGISLSTIYITMFAKPTLGLPALYGTTSIIVLIIVVKELPFTMKISTSSMLQIGNELEEAAKLSGSSWLSRFKNIIIPLNKKPLFSSFLLVFISAIKQLELIIILITPSTETLTTLTFSYAEKGYTQLTDATLILTIFIIFCVYFISFIFGRIDFAKGLGGNNEPN